MKNVFLGEYIKQRRLDLGLTQEQLCYGICEPMTLSRLENGKQTPSRNRINALLQRLGLPDDRYGVSCATIRNKMAAGEFGELVSVGERTRLVPWAGVQAYESTHTGMSTKRTSEKHRAVSHGNPGPI